MRSKEGDRPEATTRRVVVVSGAPGAGKTTVARALAAVLAMPLITKDAIKEAIWDAVDPPEANLAWSRRIGGGAMEALWAIAASPSDVLLEANFRPHSELEQTRMRGLNGRLVEVYCSCPPELAAQRYAERMKQPDHHRAHVRPTLDPEFLGEFDGPMRVGSLIVVDTTSPVDIGALAAEVSAELERAPAQGKTDQLPT